MRGLVLSQKTRFLLLLFEVGILCLASWFAFGRIFPPDGEKGFWFYTALLGLILGSRLDTPFYAKPADVVPLRGTCCGRAYAGKHMGQVGLWH